MSFINELEGWVRNWFEDPANSEELGDLVKAAKILIIIDQLRGAEEKK